MDRCLALLVLTACGRINFAPVGDGSSSSTSLCGNFEVVRPPAFTTTGSAFASVPGSELDVHVPPGEHALVWVSAALRSTSPNEKTVEARLVIDGVARATNGVQNETPDHPLPWFTFDHLQPGDHHIAVELHDHVATGRIENLHIVAFRAPVIFSDEKAAETQVGDTDVDVLATSAPIPVTGDYLVFAAASISEEPGNSNCNIGLRDPNGSVWPNGEFFTNRTSWVSAVWSRRVTLPAGPASFALFARSSGAADMATIRDMRIVIVPADAVGSRYAARVAGAAATMPGELSLSTLDVPAPAQPIDRVIIQSTTATGGLDTTGTNPIISELRHDGVTSARYENWSLSTPVVPSGFVDAYVASGATHLENTLIAVDPARGVAARETMLHALDLPCP